MHKKTTIKITYRETGITLIVLIITIIVLLILAGITLKLTIGENGIFANAKKSKDEMLISNYKEKIELIKSDLYMRNNGEQISLTQIKEEIEKEENNIWINNTEIIIDDKIEKIKLITKEGYIFYITISTIEYRGNNKSENSSINEKIKAENVYIKPNDTNWNITDVQKALDYLYNN